MSRWLRVAENSETVFFKDDTIIIFIEDHSSFYVIKALKKLPKAVYPKQYNTKVCCINKDGSKGWGYTQETDELGMSIHKRIAPKSFEELIAPASWMEGEQISQWNSAVQEILNKVKESNNE